VTSPVLPDGSVIVVCLMGIVGGATYDALILYAALKADADQVITLNERDFRRVYPDIADRIISP
jgi:predicted nucleic acid-binding protein